MVVTSGEAPDAAAPAPVPTAARLEATLDELEALSRFDRDMDLAARGAEVAAAAARA
ncbi:MAG: Diguanylate cyclase, partial [Klenkia sp.]|nr:Diguanylate cyclase [Klenkia sp.]